MVDIFMGYSWCIEVYASLFAWLLKNVQHALGTYCY